MNSLKQWLAQKFPSKHQKVINGLVLAMIVIAVLGFADATHLTISHYTGSALKCGVSGGCNAVTSSAYAKIFGIPVALLGTLYYASIILLGVGYLDTKKPLLLKLLTLAPVAGLVASLYFVLLQLFILHTICLYCMVSAGTSTAIFILSQMLRVKK